MAKTLFSFRETNLFTRRVVGLLTDDEYAKLQARLIEIPDGGDVIKGSGGIRKIRQAAKGKGTRGGARVIYYFALANEVFYMLDIYAKNEIEDLTLSKVKELKYIVEEWLKQ